MKTKPILSRAILRAIARSGKQSIGAFEVSRRNSDMRVGVDLQKEGEEQDEGLESTCDLRKVTPRQGAKMI